MVYCRTLGISGLCGVDGKIIGEMWTEKALERKRSWPNRGSVPTFAFTALMLAGVPTKMPTERLKS